MFCEWPVKIDPFTHPNSFDGEPQLTAWQIDVKYFAHRRYKFNYFKLCVFRNKWSLFGSCIHAAFVASASVILKQLCIKFGILKFNINCWNCWHQCKWCSSTSCFVWTFILQWVSRTFEWTLATKMSTSITRKCALDIVTA